MVLQRSIWRDHACEYVRGILTPPFAVGIFVGQKIAGATFTDTVKEAVPFIIVGLAAVWSQLFVLDI